MMYYSKMNNTNDHDKADWDDYRYFLAVADAGSLSAAAQRLGRSQPTVGRRIAGLEARLKARLFVRSQQGYALTPAGEAVIDAARRLAADHREIDLRVKGQSSRLVGTVAISTSESMSIAWLIPRLSRFRDLYPDIRIEVHLDSAHVDITKGEADLALRFDRPGDDDVLSARKVGRAGFGLYANAKYLRRHGTPLAIEDLHQHAFIGPAGRFADTIMQEWLDELGQSEIVACNSMLGVFAAVEGSLGMGILPEYMAGPVRNLRRLFPEQFDPVLDLWLVVHPHTRGSAKIQAVLDFLAEEVSADPLLSAADGLGSL
jgi:DNA-binding transcriptional LysR family regulator